MIKKQPHVMLLASLLMINPVQTWAQDSPFFASVIESSGFGTVDMSRAKSKVQARMMAKRAAKVDAQRNLLEVIEGVRITAGTTVKDAQLESDIIANRVKGMLRGAFIVDESITEEDGTFVAEVKLAVCLHARSKECSNRQTLSQIVLSTLEKPAREDIFHGPVQGSPPDQASAVQSYTGLIVDTTSQDFSPYFDVRIKTAAGKEVYGPGHFKPGIGNNEWLHWSRSLDDAKSMQDVIGQTPLVIAATGLSSDAELLVSDDDAVNIFTANVKNGDFLAKGRVVFVVK